MTDQVLFRVDLDASGGENALASFTDFVELSRNAIKELKAELASLTQGMDQLGSAMPTFGKMSEGVQQVEQAARRAGSSSKQMASSTKDAVIDVEKAYNQLTKALERLALQEAVVRQAMEQEVRAASEVESALHKEYQANTDLASANARTRQTMEEKAAAARVLAQEILNLRKIQVEMAEARVAAAESGAEFDSGPYGERIRAQSELIGQMQVALKKSEADVDGFRAVQREVKTTQEVVDHWSKSLQQQRSILAQSARDVEQQFQQEQREAGQAADAWNKVLEQQRSAFLKDPEGGRVERQEDLNARVARAAQLDEAAQAERRNIDALRNALDVNGQLTETEQRLAAARIARGESTERAARAEQDGLDALRKVLGTDKEILQYEEQMAAARERNARLLSKPITSSLGDDGRSNMNEAANLGRLRAAATGDRSFLVGKTPEELAAGMRDFRNEAREVGYTVLAAAWAAESFGVTGLGKVTQGGLAAMAAMNLATRAAEQNAAAMTAANTASVGWANGLQRFLLPGLLSVAGIAAGGLLVAESIAQFKSMEKEFEVVGSGAGMTAQQLGAISLAARSAGVDGTNFTRVMAQMAKDIVSVEDGMARGKVPVNDMTKALDAMGISLVDNQGKAKSTFQVTLEMADAFKRHEDQVKLTGQADETLGRGMAILGERGVELVKVFQGGAEPIKFYLELLQAMGVGTEQQAERFHELETAGTSMHATIQAIFATMGSEMAPILTSFERGIQQVALAVAKIDPGFRAAIAGALLFGGVVGALAIAFIALNAAMGPIGWAVLAAGALAGAGAFKVLSDQAQETKKHLDDSTGDAVKHFQDLQREIDATQNKLKDLTKEPTKEELGLKAQSDVVQAKISQIQAQITLMGQGAQSVAKLQEELDRMLKSGGNIDEVTKKQQDLAYVIANASNPALAAQVAQMQQQIDKLKDEKTVLDDEKKALQDSREAATSVVAAQQDQTRKTSDLVGELKNYRDELVEQRGAGDETVKMVQTVISSMEGANVQVRAAGQAAGSAYATGLSSAKDEATQAATDVATAAAKAFAENHEPIKNAGKAAGTSWADGFREALGPLAAALANSPFGGAGLGGSNTPKLPPRTDWTNPQPTPGLPVTTTEYLPDGSQVTYVNGIEVGRISPPPAGSAPDTGSPGEAPAPGGGLTVTAPPPPSHKKPKEEKVVQTAIGEFMAARGDVGDLLAEDTYGKLAAKAIEDLETGIRVPTAAGAGRDLFNQIQGLIEKGREANLPDLAQRFNDVADAAQKALADRTPEAAEEASRAIMALATDVANAQLGEAVTKQVDQALEKLHELMGGGEDDLVGSFNETWQRIADTQADGLDQIYTRLKDQQFEQSGKLVADQFVKGFQETLKQEQLTDKVQDQMDAFVEHVQDQIDNLKEKSQDSELNRLKAFGASYYGQNTVASRVDFTGNAEEDKKIQAERDKAMKQLQLEQEKLKFQRQVQEEEDRVAAAKLAKQLIQEAMAKDRAIQDEIDKGAVQEDNANRVAAYKQALEEKLHIDADSKDKLATDRQIANINRRAAQEQLQATQQAERELRASDRRMQLFFQEQEVKAHTLVGEDSDAALARVKDAQSEWNTELQQSLDLMGQMREEAEKNVRAWQDVKDTTGETVPDFQDMLRYAREAAAAVPIPQRNATASQVSQSALANVTPYILDLIRRSGAGSPDAFASQYLHGYTADVIRNMAGPGHDKELSAAARKDATDSQKIYDVMKSVDSRLSRAVSVEVTDGSARRISDAVKSQPIEITIVVDGRTERRQIDRMETRRSVSGQP